MTKTGDDSPDLRHTFDTVFGPGQGHKRLTEEEQSVLARELERYRQSVAGGPSISPAPRLTPAQLIERTIGRLRDSGQPELVATSVALEEMRGDRDHLRSVLDVAEAMTAQAGAKGKDLREALEKDLHAARDRIAALEAEKSNLTLDLVAAREQVATLKPLAEEAATLQRLFGAAQEEISELKGKPRLSRRESTYLAIIAAALMPTASKRISYQDRGASADLARRTVVLGCNVSDDAIREVLKSLPDFISKKP